MALLQSAPQLFLSSISLTEIIIKHQKDGSLFPFSYEHAQNALSALQISMLDYAARHTSYLANLPMRHKDPSDRMLIAQALAEDIPLVSADKVVSDYQGITFQNQEGHKAQLKVL